MRGELAGRWAPETVRAEGCLDAHLAMTVIGQSLEGLQRKSLGEEVQDKTQAGTVLMELSFTVVWAR